MQKNNFFILGFALIFSVSYLAGCGQRTEQKVETDRSHHQQNVLTVEERSQGWELLFDGRTLNGWRGFQKDDVTVNEKWYVHQGALVASGTGGDISGDIVTRREFENFIFKTDWKISEGGESGIFYLVAENGYPAVYATGPKYQILDDFGHPEALEDSQYTAANYAMHAPVDAPVKPAGEWNTSQIVVDNGHVEHWLNDEKVVEYQLGSDEWKELVSSGRWADYPGYGRYSKGHIAIQDLGAPVSFRNMKIRELN